MKGKSSVLKIFGVILALAGIAIGVLGVVFGSQKYKIKPSDARNAVVWVYESLEIPELEFKGRWSGTGWAVGNPGQGVRYIVTNGHVIEQAYAWPKGDDDPFDIKTKTGQDADSYIRDRYGKSLSELDMKHEIRVYFSTADDDYVVPEVVFFSGPSDKDIAILKLDETTNKRTALLIRDSDKVEVGEEVTALGFPGVSDKVQEADTVNHDIDDVTVTKGIISKRVKPSGRDYDTFQMDVSINHGNSGGPLVDKDGYVVGVNTLGNAEDSNMNYAIVSKEVMDILDSENITYATQAYKNRGLMGLVVVGIIVLAGGIVMMVIPVGKKTAPAAGAAPQGAGVAPQAGRVVPQQGANPYAAARQQPVAQGYPQQQRTPAGVATGAAAGTAAGQMSAPAAGQAQRPILKGIKGQFAGKAFDLSRGAVVLGRDPATCNLVFNKETPGISGKHCQLNYDAASGSFVLTDLGSSYGTFTGNGKKLDANVPERLSAGDIFYLADENVKFQISKD